MDQKITSVEKKSAKEAEPKVLPEKASKIKEKTKIKKTFSEKFLSIMTAVKTRQAKRSALSQTLPAGKNTTFTRKIAKAIIKKFLLFIL